MSSISVDRALQRKRAYSLLSKIFAHGVTREVSAIAQNIPVLEAVLPTQQDEDQAGVEYQDLFGFNVLPYAGVFLSGDGKLGGTAHYGLNAFYDSFGFEPVNATGVPDHISTKLEFLAFLCELEVEAEGTVSQKLVTATMLHQQGEFIQNHLVTWCFPLFSAIKGQGHLFFSEVAELTQALIMSHFEEVATKRATGCILPSSPDILGDSKTGIKEIAAYLCRPAYSGFYLTRGEIKQLANRLRIPSGFGDRGQTLSNTLRSAINFDAVPALLERLKEIAHFHLGEYEAARTDQLASILDQWIAKTEVTIQVLTRIESELLRSAQLD